MYRDLHVEFHQDSNKLADDSLLLGLIPNLRVSSFSIESQEETLSASDELHHLLLTGFRNSDSRQTLSRLSVKVAPYLVNREVQNIAIYQNLTELCLYNNICYVFALSGSPRHDSDDTWPNPITVRKLILWALIVGLIVAFAESSTTRPFFTTPTLPITTHPPRYSPRNATYHKYAR